MKEIFYIYNIAHTLGRLKNYFDEHNMAEVVKNFLVVAG